MYATHYAVVATCPTGAVAAQYLEWLIDEGHLQAVRDAGALTAEAVRLDPPPNAPPTPIRVLSLYTFAGRNEFDQYERDHAPRLRAEGAEKFGKSGITFTRETGEVIAQLR